MAQVRRSLLATFILARAVWAQEVNFFANKVYPVLEEARCRLCHTTAGVASGTRIHFPEKDATQNQIQLFGLSLSAVVDRSNPPNSLLALKPTNKTKHTGGERIKPGSEQEKILLEWVQHLASTAAELLAAEQKRLNEASAPSNQAHLVRRLTHSQYDNTVRDLLGDYSRPAVHFPPEDYVDGFKNQLRYQNMPPLLVDAYSASAEKLALNAFRAGDINHLVPCQPFWCGRREVPRSICPHIRSASIPAHLARKRVQAICCRIHGSGDCHGKISGGCADCGGGDAAVAEFPVPHGSRP